MNNILLFFHRESNYGFAIAPLETSFFQMAKNLVTDENKIHVGYTSLKNGFPESLPTGFKNIIEFDSAIGSEKALDEIENYIRQNNIDVAFGFDQPVSRPAYKTMRKAGVKTFISYYGAPMSSINSGLKLFLKKIDVNLHKYRPDHFIFESEAMAKTAIYGRGIQPKNVSIVNLGIDNEKFKPADFKTQYTHDKFNIPLNRKIVVYTGHMEERKGVHIVVQAACELVLNRNRDDIHFLFFGNHDNNEKQYDPLYKHTPAEEFIIFGGYRNDIPKILQDCYIGTIPSTGWDSFPRSALEMMSSGLPLMASRLQGIIEQVEDGITGYLFEPRDYIGLAEKIEEMVDCEDKRYKMSQAARKHVLNKFSIHTQIQNLTNIVLKVVKNIN